LSGRVSLTLVLHNHQPVGNFGWVIEDVYEHAYSPMLDALERHPGIHLGLHYSGPLLQWMAANRPEAIAQIRGLVDRGQVEIVGGGFYEPILVTLPDRDRHGQLIRMRDELEAIFGRRPAGAWLAERVWEPSLAYDLAAAGYEWTVLDDNHLRAASIREDEMWAPLTTDDRGRRLTVFGTEQGLRYRIPFKPVEDVISYLRERTTPDGRFVGMMGDDGEKFGAWPGTFEYCWSNEHWVDRLFEAIEGEAGWLSTVTPSEWLTRHRPTTRVYFPTASYVEMTEWVLPPDETPVFAGLLERAREAGLPEARFLRGGFWRNYAARYREINDLHKQMLRASEKVAAMPDGLAGAAGKGRAVDHLYQGQSNDCYWHGLFGGIYIVHMRLATLSHLIAAEDLADAAMADAAAEVPAGGVGGKSPYGARLEDTNLDSLDEILVTSPGQTVVVDPAEGAGISSWDLRASRVALASVLRRRPEAYHQRLIAHDQEAVEEALGEIEAAANPGGHAAAAATDSPKTIHDTVNVKEPGLAAFLHYDRHERRSGLVHLLPADGSTGVAQLTHATYLELGDFVECAFEPITISDGRLVLRRLGNFDLDGTGRPLVMTKTFSFGGGRSDPTLELQVEVENPGEPALSFELAVEWNVNLLGGGHNPAAYYETETGERTPHDVAGEVASASKLAFGNDYEGVRIEATAEPAARLTWYPVETISNSEAGFERVYQGSSLLFRWPVVLAPRGRRAFAVSCAVTQTIDHSAAESS
jgi:4-alpha-glucanotransferase